MASFRDLEMDWSMLCQECPDCWTSEDLQLAAELGKTLLERNKELELALKQQQNVIEDQAQEIEYLTKQTVALREVSDSRLRIYEQLEVSIQDLERANHRLVLDNSAGKKHVKTLSSTIETLEIKCEELQSTIDDLRLQVDVLKRKAQRNSELHAAPNSNPPPTTVVHLRHVDDRDDCESTLPRHQDDKHNNSERKSTPQKKTENVTAARSTLVDDEELDDTMEQVSQLMGQLREARTQSGRDQRRMTELEEQLATMSQQNRALEEQVIKLHYQKGDEMKSINEELSTLEEVRKGQMCSRCLRSVDPSDIPEDDDSSMYEELSQHRASFHMDVQAHSSPAPNINNSKEAPNLYQDLAKKYQAYIDVRNKQKRQVSLQEELSGVSFKDTDEESGNGDSLKPEQIHHPKARIQFSHTPTDFSEAETSSSGFSDETSNKYTQTDDSPASFLCKIADESDDSLSNRFKSQPEYQKLFKDIISVLKNTEQIETPIVESKPIVEEAPISPTNNEMLLLMGDDDSQSVVSSTMSELSMSQIEPTTIIENMIQSQSQPIPDADVHEQTSAACHQSHHKERVLRPLIGQPLEYLQISSSKRSSARRKNKQQHQADRSDSPVTHIIGSPKINYSSRPNSARKRRDNARLSKDENVVAEGWNGNTVQFYSSNRSNLASPTPSQGSGRFEFKPSSASQDLHKLKRLDLSYAEVLRNPDPMKSQPRHHNRRHK